MYENASRDKDIYGLSGFRYLTKLLVDSGIHGISLCMFVRDFGWVDVCTPWICYEIGFWGNECIQHTVWRSDTEYAILCLIQVTICEKETIDV